MAFKVPKNQNPPPPPPRKLKKANKQKKGDPYERAYENLMLVDTPSQTEKVNHPLHYGGDTTYEVIKVIEAWGLDKDFCLGNTVKYIARSGKKDTAKLLEDLKKAQWYLARKIQQLQLIEFENEEVFDEDLNKLDVTTKHPRRKKVDTTTEQRRFG